MSGQQEKDPYVSKSKEDDLSTETKVNDLLSVIKSLKTAMLTTRTSEGDLVSRAMNPVDNHGLDLRFFANNTSGKFDDLDSNAQVNVSYVDPSNAHWVSISATAKRSQDQSLIKSLYNPALAAWVGDLGDGVHTGGPEDPRWEIIEVKPSKIVYYYSKRTSVGSLLEVATGAVTGRTAAPGGLRTIEGQEIEEARKISPGKA